MAWPKSARSMKVSSFHYLAFYARLKQAAISAVVEGTCWTRLCVERQNAQFFLLRH